MADGATAPAPDEPLADVVILHDNQGDQVVAGTDENRARAREEAAHRKALFTHRLNGAQARAGLLPRKLTAALASGATNLMLAEILHGDVVPTTAKEAADVAKITHSIAVQALGQTADNTNLTPEERQERLQTVTKLENELRERAEQAKTIDIGGAAGPDDGPLIFDHDDEPDDDEPDEVVIPDPYS